MLETTPSVVYSELYNTTNRMLDEVAYRLANTLTPDKMLDREICIRCQQCVKNCPVQAFTHRPDRVAADMDKQKCALYHQELKGEYRYPCGRCTAVCPIGQDKKRYGTASVSQAGIAHVQNFGSLNAVRDEAE